MTAFSPFIRKTSPDMRKALAEHLRVLMPEDVDWSDPGLKFAKLMAAAIDAGQADGNEHAVGALERITSLTNELGDLAMASCWPDGADEPELGGVEDRAVWLFINHSECFRRAEEAVFIDGRRRSNRFDGHVLSSDLTVLTSDECKAAFSSALRGALSDGKIQVDIFERTRRGFDGAEYHVVQVTIYAEQRLEATLEFQGAKIASVPRRPVVAAALTYEPLTGTVEVAANTKPARDTIVRAFAQNLVDKSTDVAALPPRRFTLQHLKRPHKFPTDAVDLIEEVTLRSLRLMPLGREDQRLTLEIGRRSSQSIWEMAQSQFMERNPLVGGWLVTSATLAVTFRPMGKGKRGKTISLKVTEPNGCDLKDRTELEQLLGNKYLRRWEILIDEPELLGD